MRRENRPAIGGCGGLAAAEILLRQDRLGLLLRLGDVWFVERIDPEHRTRNRGCEFPPEELRAQPANTRRETQHGMPRRFQGVQARGVWRVAIGRNRDERTVAPVLVRTAERFVDDGERALVVFAGALGDELFDPESEGSQRWREGDGQLVASFGGVEADEHAEIEAGVGITFLAAA